ncbi:MAG: NAD(P)/FAD-dependent oxidoreductase [Peptoniphilaceae bacterium]
MLYDLIIVGGGPAGLSAAIYAGRDNLNTLIIEKKAFGGRLKDTWEIVNFPSRIKDTGIGLINDLKEHAKSYNNNKFIYGTVISIEKQDNIFIVETKRKGQLSAKAIILCLGTVSKRLGIKGEEEFLNRGVSSCSTCDGEFFSGMDIHVVGSGDSALEEADYLTRFANRVSIIVIHDEGIVDGNDSLKNKLMSNPKIDFIWNSTLVEIKGEEYVQKIKIKDLKTKEIKKLSSEGVFIFIGSDPQTSLVEGIVDLDEKGYIIVDEKKQTSIKGLFAAGDCTNGYLKQVISAVSEGATAAVAAERFIRYRGEDI